MTEPAPGDRRSLAEDATELVEAVKVWSGDPAVRAQLATAATSLLEAGAALLDTVAARQRARQDRLDEGSEEPSVEPGPPTA